MQILPQMLAKQAPCSRPATEFLYDRKFFHKSDNAHILNALVKPN